MQVLKVFISGPGDTHPEKLLVERAVQELNSGLKKDSVYRLKSVHWEDIIPSFGRPQEWINKHMKKADVLVVVFGSTWGSATGEYTSGTEEEFHCAIAWIEKTGSPHLLTYFRRIPPESSKCPEDTERIQNLKKQIQANKLCLYREFLDAADFSTTVKSDLQKWLDEKLRSIPSTFEVGTDRPEHKTIFDLERALRSEIALREESEAKLAGSARQLALQALDLAGKGQHQAAIMLFENSIHAARTSQVMNVYGVYCLLTGDVEKAESLFEEAQDVARKQSADWLYSSCNLAKLWVIQGKVEKATKLLERLLPLSKAKGLPSLAGRICSNLCEAALRQGNQPRAIEELKKAAAFYGESRNLVETGHLCSDLAILYRRSGQYGEARKWQSEAVRIFEKADDSDGIAMAFYNLSIICEVEDRLEEAEECLSKAEAIAKTMDNQLRLACVYGQRGIVLYKSGRLRESEECLTASFESEKRLGHKYGMAHDLFHRSLVRAFMVDRGAHMDLLDAAKADANEANLLYSELGDGERAETAAQLRRGIEQFSEKVKAGRMAAAEKKASRLRQWIRERFLRWTSPD